MCVELDKMTFLSVCNSAMHINSLLLTPIHKEKTIFMASPGPKTSIKLFTDIYCFIAGTTLHGYSTININLLFTELVFQVSKVENQKDM